MPMRARRHGRHAPPTHRGWWRRGRRQPPALVLLAVAWLLLSVGKAWAAPALWRFQDEDSTIYLFGTIHILRPETRWRDAGLDAVLEKVDHFVFELAEDRIDPLTAQRLVLDKGFLSGKKTLTGLVPAPVRARLAQTADRLGLPLSALDRMRPWYAALQVTIATARQMGLQAENGIDRALAAYAKARGVSIDGLETLREQIDLFADMPLEDEIAFLASALAEAARDETLLIALETAWAEGRVQELAALLDQELEKHPRLIARLLTTRNRHWVTMITGLLLRPGVHFVAVGSAHLVGPDNLIGMLRVKGITVERVR